MSGDLQNRRIGLAGANGFIGSAIFRYLHASGISPRTLCGPGAGSVNGPENLICDLTDSAQLQCWVTGLETVIHAAGPPSVRRSFEIPQEYVRVHVQGTTALLEACRSAGVKQIVYLSSAEVYGRAEQSLVPETHGLQPRSPYAVAKLAAEKMIAVYVQSFGLNATVLRPFSIYGPNPTPESLFGSILSMSREGCIHLHDLRPVRDYCHVDDLAIAVLRACLLQNQHMRVVNIGTGKGTSVGEFAECVLKTLGLNLPVVEDRSRSRNHSEIFDLVADITSAQNLLGWTAQISLSDGLRRAIAASRETI